MDEIWMLGATGRTGRAIAARLATSGRPPVLVGRDRDRLRAVADEVGGAARVVVAQSLGAAAGMLAAAEPAVVVNTVGPFARNMPLVAGALPDGSHYVDLTNEIAAVSGLLARHEEAAARGQCLVAGAGFGVFGAESVVRWLCAGRPPAERVRVDAVPAVVSEPGRLGEALAASVVGGIALGGRRYEHGRLVRAPFGGDTERFTLPDGTPVRTGAVPFGDLEVAHRASGAPFAVAASSAAPTGHAARAAVAVASALLARPRIAAFATRRLARVPTRAGQPGREHSWVRARVTEAGGAVREGWLRAGEGMAFTADVAAEVALRLARGEGTPGAHTPGALFGPGLAEKAGGVFLAGGAGS
ncbi:hypothetical protein [Streptomyces sp. NPDC050560]|uniref:hypothetical protein n=1 Tax=Streptomyces sp. NPDC050560 TaxID=3365630 RepID=UPI00378E9953